MLPINELVSEAAKVMSYDPIKFFLKGCVEECLSQRVEKNAPTLADRNSFSESDITFMKEHSLGDLEYELPPPDSDSPLFKIKARGSDDGVLFSLRSPTKGELRGKILMERIDELRTKNPEMSLYNALALLVQDPKMNITMFYSNFPSTNEYFITPDGSSIDVEKKVVIISGLSKFSSACISYIREKRDEGVSDKSSIELLRKIFMAQKEDILSSSFNEDINTEDLSIDLKNRITKFENKKKQFKSFFHSINNKEMFDLLAFYDIELPATIKPVLKKKAARDIFRAFENVESTAKIRHKLRKYGFSNFTDEKIEMMRKQAYFNKLNPNVRDIIRDSISELHVAKPPFSLSFAARRSRKASTTTYVIDRFNARLEDAIESNNFDILREDLKLLGLDEHKANLTISDIKKKLSIEAEVKEVASIEDIMGPRV